MPFLNSLVDPYGVLARGTYGEDDDEDWRNRRPTQRVSASAASPPATPPGDGGRGGGGGRGDFLASLAQMGPLIAQIFQSTATGDSIQRALADHAATMERYNESRRLQAERATERSFAAEQAGLDRVARKEERAEDRAFRTDLFDREQAADEERFERRTALDSAARAEDKALRAAERGQEVANKLGVDLQGALAFNTATSEQVAAWKQQALDTGVRPPEAEAVIAKALRIGEEVEYQRRLAATEGREITPQEQAYALARGQHKEWVDEFGKLDPIQRAKYPSLGAYVSAAYGPDQWASNVEMRRIADEAPPPPEPAGVTIQRALQDPTHPSNEQYRQQIRSWGPGEMRSRLPGLLAGVADKDALLDALEEAASDEARIEIKKLRQRTTTRLGQAVGAGADRAMGAVRHTPGYGVLSDVGTNVGNALSGIGNLGSDLMDYWLSPIPRDDG